MGKWLELAYTLRSKRNGLLARVGSNPTLPTILIILLVSIFSFGQDQGNNQKEQDITKMMRPEIQNKLCKMFVRRYVQPLVEWQIVGAAGNVLKRDDNGQYIRDDKEYWFVLIIHPEKNKGEPLWIKFYLAYKCLPNTSLEDGNAVGEWAWNVFWDDKLVSLTEQVEQCIIEHMQDVEFENAIIFGESHLYVIATKDSDVKLLKEKDRIQ